jgi:predicted DCC family thiol-disulfide oxidoreductase YuxK
MTRVAKQGPGHQATHLVLYDGVCGLCNRSVQFVLERDRRAAFQFASLQSATGQAMVARMDAIGGPDDSMSLRRQGLRRAFTRRATPLFVSELGWPWKALLIARICPRALRDRLYDIVARTRYRVFGRYDHCVLPRPEHRGRFVDEGRV